MDDDWWRGATLYQVYPRSFADANGDGVGDLAGVTAHLDYVASLGVDGIWLSPFFPSPMRDFGYDVSDHCGVDPLFGSMADFDALLARAHALGLRVVIDQVWSHTALEHPWFQDSRASRDNARADWYVWADAKPDGSPPSNWQSWMGGPTWTWEPRRQQYYLHNFLPQMPDLNLHHPQVREALLEVGRFWLDKGVDGFRLDTANYYCHDPRFTDNPPQPAHLRGDMPAAMQVHLHNVCQPQTLGFLEQVRSLLDSYAGRTSVAEIGSVDNLARMIEYTQGRQRLHTAYSFVLLGSQPSPAGWADLMRPWEQGEGAAAWPAWALSNHDVPRVATRWAQGDPQRTQQLLVLLAALRGTVFLYQGEELGLPQAELAAADMRDPCAWTRWPPGQGRDGCRTPMPWRAHAEHAGFSSARPWLPLSPPHAALAVDAQEQDGSSSLHLTRRALALRQAHAVLRRGSFEVQHADAQALVVLRRLEGRTALLALNFSAETWQGPLPEVFPGTDDLALGQVQVGQVGVEQRKLQMGPWSALLRVW